jgi:magnesium transporter
MKMPARIPKIRRIKHQLPPPGAPQGILPTIPSSVPPMVTRTIYGDGHCAHETIAPNQLHALFPAHPGKRMWVDVQGVGHADTIRLIAEQLALHPLTVEDIVHVHQRPKAEEFADYLFIVVRTIRIADALHIANDQISMVIKDDLLVTFQEQPSAHFDPIRERLRENRGHVAQAGVDFLAYCLIDATIDHFYPVLDLYGDVMEHLDDEMREHPTPRLADAVHAMRRELRQLRRSVWPLREMISLLGHGEFPRLGTNLRPAFRDCYDHLVQVVDFVENNRERANDLADVYLAAMSEKNNQVIKILTIMTTLFIPLTFLCGVYGMNFEPHTSPYNMPELHWQYGYPAVWIVMLASAFGMLMFFRRKGWIGNDNSK